MVVVEGEGMVARGEAEALYPEGKVVRSGELELSSGTEKGRISCDVWKRFPLHLVRYGAKNLVHSLDTVGLFVPT